MDTMASGAIGPAEELRVVLGRPARLVERGQMGKHAAQMGGTRAIIVAQQTMIAVAPLPARSVGGLQLSDWSWAAVLAGEEAAKRRRRGSEFY